MKRHAIHQKKSRKKKYVVWLHNFTDSRDDEWVAVWAHSSQEAKDNASYESNRFCLGPVYTAAGFRKRMGISA